MEPKIAKISAVSVTATMATACIAIAAVAGGLFAEAASPSQPRVKQVEMIDDYIVVHSTDPATTSVPEARAAELMAIAPVTVAIVPAQAPVAAIAVQTESEAQTTAARPSPSPAPVAPIAAPAADKPRTPDKSAAGGGDRIAVDETTDLHPKSDDHNANDD